MYQEFIAQLEAGNLDKTLGDMIKEQGQTENTEKLIEMYKTEFEMLKK